MARLGNTNSANFEDKTGAWLNRAISDWMLKQGLTKPAMKLPPGDVGFGHPNGDRKAGGKDWGDISSQDMEKTIAAAGNGMGRVQGVDAQRAAEAKKWSNDPNWSGNLRANMDARKSFLQQVIEKF